ncbi:ABC transporter ATP-binding protein [Mariluticola halotolerans]|uniref:ABC transporter ATP-binding protein n=1 Tax=Mariluticola halotolerans TaxID=2909283 RepID=UPI0026E39C76|nr:ABC transporter ATP-binding protein [Mariluticola halotolerans]UJQ93571.1 ABC transporter ATP-binding protein [Mariluticola halotolerans]
MAQGVRDEHILEIENIGKSFMRQDKSELVALDDINLQIKQGSFTSIVGASGSGKSTLLRIIDGLLTPSQGTVKVNRQVVTKPGKDRAVVFQNDSLLPWKTVIQNVAYGLTLSGMKWRDAAKIAQGFIDLAGLSGFENQFPHQLSGGMRQRVNVARGLAVDPDILLLDEPFAALDSQTREIMQTELLRIWQQSGKTVVLITHQIDEAVFLSDEVVVFSARPGTVRERIPISLPRPRDLNIKRSMEFVGLVDQIWKLIEDEVKAATKL